MKDFTVEKPEESSCDCLKDFRMIKNNGRTIATYYGKNPSVVTLVFGDGVTIQTETMRKIIKAIDNERK